MRRKKEVLVKMVKEVSEYEEEVKLIPQKLSYMEIAQLVSEAAGWPLKGLFVKSRLAEKAFRRSVIDLVATCNGCSIKECAVASSRDHTTIIHSLRSIEDRLDTCKITRKLLSEIMRDLEDLYEVRFIENPS